ncbi:hypothetical protein [uncultured Thiohalocapsa sp.]|uniref:hypothetical protein n=1 Tax=uncultured Thiohalocapsa sp. TaxID=768990 RepID=UPI0025F6ADB6|nr:hypothetical protein [uncultured Thiohalocapsa sp.]
MTVNLLHAAVAAAREVANLILLGGLFFLLYVQLPAIARLRSARARLALRKASFGRVFLWGWLGLGVLWLTAVYDLLRADGQLPAYSGAAAALAAVFTFIFLIAQFGLYTQSIIALEEGNAERAAWLNHHLRWVLRVAFLLALSVLLLQQVGPALIPPEGFSVQALLPSR